MLAERVAGGHDGRGAGGGEECRQQKVLSSCEVVVAAAFGSGVYVWVWVSGGGVEFSGGADPEDGAGPVAE